MNTRRTVVLASTCVVACSAELAADLGGRPGPTGAVGTDAGAVGAPSASAAPTSAAGPDDASATDARGTTPSGFDASDVDSRQDDVAASAAPPG